MQFKPEWGSDIRPKAGRDKVSRENHTNTWCMSGKQDLFSDLNMKSNLNSQARMQDTSGNFPEHVGLDSEPENLYCPTHKTTQTITLPSVQTEGGPAGIGSICYGYRTTLAHHHPVSLELPRCLAQWSGLQIRSAVGGPSLALLASLCSSHLVLWHTRAHGKLLTLLSAHCWGSILKEDHSGFQIRKSKLTCVVSSSYSSVYHLIILSSVGSLEKVAVKLKLFILFFQEGFFFIY